MSEIKTPIKIMLIITLAIVSGCSFHKTKPKDALYFLSGNIASVATHWAGHAIYLESKGINWRQDGFREVVEDPISDSEFAAMGRAGFVAQLAVGIILSMLDDNINEYFTRGYHTASFLEISTYRARWTVDGDLECIDRENGNANWEWAGYTSLSAYLLFKDLKGDFYESNYNY